MENQGMDPSVQEAMARRGMGGQQGSQPQQAGMGGQMAPMMSGGQSMPMMDMGGQMPMGAPKSDKFVPKDSHELLVSTLAESLKNEYKLKEEQLKFGQAPMMA
jgi:hypothetical protein